MLKSWMQAVQVNVMHWDALFTIQYYLNESMVYLDEVIVFN